MEVRQFGCFQVDFFCLVYSNHVLVLAKDTDPAITSFATANWTSHLGFTETQHWRPWTVDGCQQMGGYVTRYQGDFDFVTIRGAGHMVPTNKPEATFAFMSAWIHEKDYLTFNKTCTRPSLQVQEGEIPSESDVLQDCIEAEKKTKRSQGIIFIMHFQLRNT